MNSAPPADGEGAGVPKGDDDGATEATPGAKVKPPVPF